MPRPKKLQTVLVEQMGESALEAARRILADALLEKLREQNVCTDGLPIDELVESLTGGANGALSWGEGDGRDITISFTEREEKELLSRLESVANLAQDPEFIQKCLDSAATSLLRSLEKDWSERKIHDESELYGFRRRIALTWGAPLDNFRMMLTISRDSFVQEAASLRKSKATQGMHLREALIGIHARALRTATAIIVLLENGLADDAYARWRTLYELSVIAAFLSEHGEKAAERYLVHEFVVLKKRLDNELSWNGKKIRKKQQRKIVKDYDWTIATYGKSFQNDYGWAAGFVDNDNPRFVNIEKSVKGKMIAPPYKESSQQVHGGRGGLLGLSSSDDLTAIGHSNLGLDIPLMHSSLCLMQVTNLHLYHCPSRDLVYISVFRALHNKIERQCRKVATKLQNAR